MALNLMQDIYHTSKYTNLLFQKSTLHKQYKNQQIVNSNS